MSYQKQNFANGEVLTAAQLNHIENGITDVESAANATKGVVDKIIDPSLSVSGKAADAKKTGDKVGELKEDLDNIATSNINILENLQFTSGKYYGYESHNIESNDDFGIFEKFNVEAGKTYYYIDIFGNFSSIRYSQSNKFERLNTSITGIASGIFIPEEDGVVAITGTKSSNYRNTLFTQSKEMYESRIFVSYYKANRLIIYQNNIKNIYYVEKDDTGDFTKLTDAISEAIKYMDSVIYVGKGTWDIIDELGSDYIENVGFNQRGIYLKNRVHIIFDSNSKVVCNYTGTTVSIRKWLSAFNAGKYGFTLENANIESSNCRYTIHDERDQDDDFYINRYINCKMYHDNTNNPDSIGADQCIGGGLGKNGYVVIDGCYFDGLGEYSAKKAGTLVSYHNTAGADGKSKIVLKNSYFAKAAGARFDWYGQSTAVSEAFVMGCSFGRKIVNMAETSDGSSPNENMKVIEWNNVIRTN